MTPDVIAEPEVQVWLPQTGLLPTTCRFHYAPSEPYAVRVTAACGGTTTLTWTFARSLLAEGAHGHAGVGNVRVWRVRDTAEELVALVLPQVTGPVHLYVPLGALTAFLAATDAAVEPGSEQLAADLDAELRSLLDGSG